MLWKDIKNVSNLSLLAVLLGICSDGFASGFHLNFMNVADLGDAYAGGAAVAEDASTNYYNPAGLVRIKQQQIVAAGNFISNYGSFTGTSYAPGLAPPGTGSTQTGTATSDVSGVVPALHYASPLNDRFYFGVSLTVPYALGFEYPDNSVIAYDVTRAELMSIDVGPSVAYKVTDKFSAGFGLDALFLKVNQDFMVRTQPLTAGDSMSSLNVSGWGYGWHGGLLYQFTPSTRVGLSYHSGIKDEVSGKSQFIITSGLSVPNGITASDTARMPLSLPPITTLSLYHDINKRWAVMSSLEYIQWDVFKNQIIYNAAGPGSITPVTIIPQYFHNTWFYALGTSYQLNEKWMLRTGAAYEQGATNNVYRDMVIPDAGKIDLAVGAHYQATKKLGIDGGYMYTFFKSAGINYVNGTSGVTLNGTSKLSGNALGLQLTYDI